MGGACTGRICLTQTSRRDNEVNATHPTDSGLRPNFRAPFGPFVNEDVRENPTSWDQRAAPRPSLDCLIIIDEIRIFLQRSWILAKADAIFQLSEGSIFHDRGPEREPQYDRTPGRTPAAD
jgi:hypothetical protein